MPPNVFWMRMCSLTPIRSPATGSRMRCGAAVRRPTAFGGMGGLLLQWEDRNPIPFMVLTQSLLPTSMAPVPAPITP